MSFLSKIKVNGENQKTKKFRNERFMARKQQAKKLRSLRDSIQKAENELAKKQSNLAGEELRLLKTQLHKQMINAIQRILADYQSNSSEKNISKLEKLASLREKNILTEKEYQNKKEELLSRI